jgi:lipoprotein-anchoring transpeptidase ErfK/SrfK
MRNNFILAAVFAAFSLGTASHTLSQTAPATQISIEAVNSADLSAILALQTRIVIVTASGSQPTPVQRDPALVKLQTLLDQHGASPGVVDGFDGDNLRKAIIAFQIMAQLPTTGMIDENVLTLIDSGQPVVGTYAISFDDQAELTAETPEDYADKAAMSFLGYASVQELLAERFHMDSGLLKDLNPNANFVPGETINVIVAGENKAGAVARIEADKTLRQVRAYDAQGMLVAAYPATIGSAENPSPTGSYVVEVVAPMPDYTYNPEVNFQQGDNTDVLTIPPGPNGPVGSMWIGLSKPTYGIHGTPEPSLIDKVGSNGCVRLTNWDAEELASMVSAGVTVDFI